LSRQRTVLVTLEEQNQFSLSAATIFFPVPAMALASSLFAEPLSLGGFFFFNETEIFLGIIPNSSLLCGQFHPPTSQDFFPAVGVHFPSPCRYIL